MSGRWLKCCAAAFWPRDGRLQGPSARVRRWCLAGWSSAGNSLSVKRTVDKATLPVGSPVAHSMMGSISKIRMGTGRLGEARTETTSAVPLLQESGRTRDGAGPIVVIVKHLTGNIPSRWPDFPTNLANSVSERSDSMPKPTAATATTGKLEGARCRRPDVTQARDSG